MTQTAALLNDYVLTEKPYRQWVLNLRWPLRMALARMPDLVAPMLERVVRCISTTLATRAGFPADKADTGGIAFIQRFGSGLNLNIHNSGNVYRNSSVGHLIVLTAAIIIPFTG